MSGIGTPSPYPSPVTSSSWSLHSFLLSPCHNCRTQTVLFNQHEAMVWYCQILTSPSTNYRKQRTMALAYQSEISNQLRVRCCGRVVKKTQSPEQIHWCSQVPGRFAVFASPGPVEAGETYGKHKTTINNFNNLYIQKSIDIVDLQPSWRTSLVLEDSGKIQQRNRTMQWRPTRPFGCHGGVRKI